MTDRQQRAYERWLAQHPAALRRLLTDESCYAFAAGWNAALDALRRLVDAFPPISEAAPEELRSGEEASAALCARFGMRVAGTGPIAADPVCDVCACVHPRDRCVCDGIAEHPFHGGSPK